MSIMRRFLLWFVMAGVCFSYCGDGHTRLSLTDEQAEWIGAKIFRNECGAKDACLTTWNKGENFLSLGIGHCIWYPALMHGPFKETFPELLMFMKENGVVLPDWLEELQGQHCPWNSRDEFMDDIEGSRARDLRRLLVETKGLQLIFIINRLKDALPEMMKAAGEAPRPDIEKYFYLLTSTPAGIYALADYLNFKGEGTLASERYKGRGWGLLQVLERMKEVNDSGEAVREFVRCAEEVLTERVNNAPRECNEQRWLRGWKKRVNTYIDAMGERSSDQASDVIEADRHEKS